MSELDRRRWESAVEHLIADDAGFAERVHAVRGRGPRPRRWTRFLVIAGAVLAMISAAILAFAVTVGF